MITKNLVVTKPLLWGAIFAASLTLTACGGGSGDGPLATPDELVTATENGLDDPTTLIPETTETPAPTAATPTGLITGVSASGVDAIYYLGSPPESVGSLVLNPLTDDAEAVSVISGGSQVLPVSSDQAFSSVYVLTDDDGYFLVLLPENSFSTEVVVSFNPVLSDQASAQLDVAVAGSDGSVSETQSLELETVLVGTGDVQISISWDRPNDVDLYVLEPDGTQISFDEPTSPSGGMLDLDSNPACNIDNVNNENVTYENATPPSGEYLVGVDLYAACDVTGPTNFVVTVRSGGSVRTFRGVLQPSDENATMVREVTRFIVN